MKSSLKKLRGFTLGRNGGKDKQSRRPPPHYDEIARAADDIREMIECYDGLMSSSAHTSNSVFELSEALQDLGTCLLAKTALNMDEDSGKVLIMLGKVQYELHKLLDRYRVHIARTITIPSEVLLTELNNVQEMREQCEEKRKAFEVIREEKSRGKLKFSKGENVTSEQLKVAKEDYDNQAMLLVCRLMSLKQGQPRSLLVQAARHYTAQLQLFRKGLAALEALEPHVRQIAEQQHIEYRLSEMEEDDGEISFEFSQNDHDYDESSSSENSMEVSPLDRPEVLHASAYSQTGVEKNEHRLSASRNSIGGTRSAPLSASSYRKSTGIEKSSDTNLQSRNLHTYALPTPDGAKSGNISASNTSTVGARNSHQSGVVSASWNTSPLESAKNSSGTGVLPMRNELNANIDESRAQPLPEEPLSSSIVNPVPPSLRFETPVASESKRIKRYSHSGPLTGKSWSSQPIIPSSGPLAPRHTEFSSKYGLHGRSIKSRHSCSAKLSPGVSPSNLSPPHVSQLYELPKPPVDSTRISKASDRILHSAPLTAKSNQEYLSPIKQGQIITKSAAPLPQPPSGPVTRSFSIPSRALKGHSMKLPKLSEVSRTEKNIEEITSPPLTPIPFSTIKGKLHIEEIFDGVEPAAMVEVGRHV